MKNYSILILIFASVMLYSCGSSSTKKSTQTYQESPVDKLMKDMDKEKSYSIVLFDMDFNDKDFKHKYKIITNLEDSVSRKEKVTDWYSVEQDFFVKNQDNLGLELAGKSVDGKISKIPSPPGYHSYVGNEKYGQWRQDNSGNSFWEFYGRYAFMSSMFNMMSTPIYRNGYDNYRSSYNSGRSYYGERSPNGTYSYGTSSPTVQKSNPNFYDRHQGKTDAFKQSVQSRVTQSSNRSTTSGSSSRSNSSPSNSSSRTNTSPSTTKSSSSGSTSRSSSRSSSGSSSTSRSSSGSGK